jgi:hypothetical protein
MPSWMLAPLACRLLHDALAPRLSVEALVALRALLDRQPLLHTTIPATPCGAQPAGARDAQESSALPSVAGPRARPHPRRVAAATHRQAPAVSRAPRLPAPRHQPPGPERGVSPGAPRGPRALSHVPPPSLSASPQAIQSAPIPSASGGTLPSWSRPAGWDGPPSWCSTRPWAGVEPDATSARAWAHGWRRCVQGGAAPAAPGQPPDWPATTGTGILGWLGVR